MFTFRKRVKLFPGVSVNISKKGFSFVSVGPRGFKHNISKRGVTRTVGLPGTGFSHRETVARFDQEEQPQEIQLVDYRKFAYRWLLIGAILLAAGFIAHPIILVLGVIAVAHSGSLFKQARLQDQAYRE